MSFPRRAVLLASMSSAILLAVPMLAQSSASVVPGIRIDYRPARERDTIVYNRSVTVAGRDSAAGTRTVVLQVVQSAGGAKMIEVSQRFPGGGGIIVDTALADLTSLGAVAHASHQPARTMHFSFHDGTATGTVASLGVPSDTSRKTESVQQQLGGPIFDSNIIEMVIAALPLREKFTAELPFFIYERGGRVAMPVAVRERAHIASPALGDRDAWVVTVGVPGAPATIWVDAKTRVVLRVRYDIAARSMSFTDDRMTALPEKSPPGN